MSVGFASRSLLGRGDQVAQQILASLLGLPSGGR